jgi:hypothetical protein
LDTLRDYRSVASKWPVERRVPDTSWRAHKQMCPTEDNPTRWKLLKPGMTLTRALKAAGLDQPSRDPDARTIERSVQRLTPVEKADLSRKLYMDPEVIAVESGRRDRHLDEIAPERLTNRADIKAVQAETREMFEPTLAALAVMRIGGDFDAVVSAIHTLIADIRQAGKVIGDYPDDVRAVQAAMDELLLTSYEADFGAER